jgi:EmrB/QacA subfamily drug resistance transporter
MSAQTVTTETTKSKNSTTQNIILLAMILAVSMTTIDQTIMALAANTIQSGLGISHAAITWSVNAYILATAAFFMLGGKLADVFGHKRMAIIGIIWFAVCSLLCSLTPVGHLAVAWLITSRALQGVGTALMFPAALGIVRNSFPAHAQGRAAATFFSVTGAMIAIGPIAGSYLVQWTWRSIFWINIPIALLALALIARRQYTSKNSRTPIDWEGAVISAAGMIILVGGLEEAGNWGWSSLKTWLCFVAGATLLGYFWRVERNKKYPLLNVGLFAQREFTISTIAIFLASIAFIPVFFFMSAYAQVSLNLSVGNSAILILEFFIGYVIGSRFGGKFYDHQGAKKPYIIGGLLGAVGFAWWASKLSDLQHGGAFANSPQFWPILLAGIGVGLMFSIASTDIASRSTSQAYGEASGVSQTARNLGGALGLAILSAILTVQLSSNLTSSFTKLGIPSSEGKIVAQDINTDNRGSSQSNQLKSLTPNLRQEFSNVVSESYASASKPVYYGMAVAMTGVFILGELYPSPNKHIIKNQKM